MALRCHRWVVRAGVRTLGYGARVNRWDETWHRLLEWTNGSPAAERLAGVVLSHEEYCDFDPVHPLGGPDGRSDATAFRDGRKWSVAVYFPRGPQSFGTTRAKFSHDLPGVAASGATGMVFFTNQEVTRTQREELRYAGGDIVVEVYHLERLTTILDQPAMHAVREQFLGIDTAARETLLSLQVAEAAAKRKIYPRITPDGFQFLGEGAVFGLLVQAQTENLFMVTTAHCLWHLNHDDLYKWAVRSHVRLAGEPEPWRQELDITPLVVRLDAPYRFSVAVRSAELGERFRPGRTWIDGMPSEPLPVHDIVRGKLEVRCEPLLGDQPEVLRYELRWPAHAVP